MHIVYILRSKKDGSYYTGSTTNLRKRLAEHSAKSDQYSSSRKPFQLVWFCGFPGKDKALKFEKYLKIGSGFAFAKKRLV